MPHDRYQTVQELAERLEVAEETVRRWIKSGELRAIDIGKGWRVADADLERFLRAHETTPRQAEEPAGGRRAAGHGSAGPVRRMVDRHREASSME